MCSLRLEPVHTDARDSVVRIGFLARGAGKTPRSAVPSGQQGAPKKGHNPSGAARLTKGKGGRVSLRPAPPMAGS